MSSPTPQQSARIDLGIAVFQCFAIPGECYTCEEIAAWAGCSAQNIYLIEQAALNKLRVKLAAELRELRELGGLGL